MDRSRKSALARYGGNQESEAHMWESTICCCPTLFQKIGIASFPKTFKTFFEKELKIFTLYFRPQKKLLDVYDAEKDTAKDVTTGTCMD